MFDTLSPSGVVAAALIAPAGSEVIAALDRVDAARLPGRLAVDLLAAWERQAAWLGSRTAEAMRAVASAVRTCEDGLMRDDPELAERSVHCEIAAATRVSEIGVGHRLMVAEHLGGRLACVDKALRAGDINLWQASAICTATDDLTDEQAQAVARRVLPRARKQTLAQLRQALRRAIMSIVPNQTRKNAATARVRHDVELFRRNDGQAELRVTGDAADLTAVYRIIQDAARKLGALEKGTEFPRSAGQLRVAALLGLVTGTLADADSGEVIRPYKVTVNVTIDLPTLLGLRDNPADLGGYGPYPPSLARDLAADGVWRRLIFDPQTGGLLDLGKQRYRPSTRLADYIRARNRTCVWPGCNRRAETCDLDHSVPHGAGGETSRANLRPFCTKHHRLKHEANWTLRTYNDRAPEIISPLGRSYPIEEYDYRPPDDTDFELPPPEPEPFISRPDGEVAAGHRRGAGGRPDSPPF